MSPFRLSPQSLEFPPAHLAGPDGLLAIGGDFRPERMIVAYSRGIFPWMVYSGEPVWFSPDPRMVLIPREIHVPRSLAKIIRRGDYEIRFDTALGEVIRQCALMRRPGQRGTWITKRYAESFMQLGELGIAHSAEAWQGGRLVGGVYGMALGKVFFGESMFAHAPDASKVAFAVLVRELIAKDFALIDCQQETEHLRRFGATAWSRERFLAALAEHIGPDRGAGKWPISVPGWDGRVPDTGAPPDLIDPIDPIDPPGDQG